MRSLWTGSISFGLVNIPVHMYSGTNPRQGIDLDMLHKKDHSPIRYARICRKDGEEIPWDDIVKGYEYEDGDYVVLTQADMDKTDEKQTRTIDIQQFVAEPEIDIRYFDKPYYLEPDEGAAKAYVLLREALERSGKIALAKFILHEREHLAVIKPVGAALVLNQMRFPTDIRPGTDLKLPKDTKVSDDEVKLALQLIHQQTKHFAPEDYHDTYTEKLEEMIEDKVKGHKPKSHAKKAAEKTESKDIMAALKASLESAKK
ncbi:MAG TPA: Ku protein [Candidatus Saccharimonadales bacterium]|nr:Ku protein [Candidatus Saccharimonadales bacterium]